MPESEIRATRVFGPDGQFLRPVTPEWILQDVAEMVEHPDYESIPAQILAIYTVYNRPEQLSPRYNTADHLPKLNEIYCAGPFLRPMSTRLMVPATMSSSLTGEEF